MAGRRKAAYYGRSLKLLFLEWNRTLKKGGSDREVTDGYTLNCIRDSILQTMKVIRDTFPEGEYPEDYYAPVPDPMPADYMADPEGIRQNAKTLHGRLCRCSQWRWLLEQEENIPETVKLGTDFYHLKGMAEKLAEAIDRDDLLGMRQFDDPDDLMVMILNCHSKIVYFQGRRKKAGRTEKRDDWIQMTIEDWIA